MANLVDSEADFKAGVTKVGLGAYYQKMTELGLTTYANFAFSSAYQPGSPDESVFVKDVVVPILADNVALRPALRRLYFEAHTYVTADMRNRVEKTDEDKPRKMSVQEREARRQRVVPKLQGLDTENVHDPSDSLCNLAYGMYEDNRIKYVLWEKCTSNSDERKGITTVKQWKPDSNGIVKETVTDKTPEIHVQTGLDLHDAFIRRGIALEIGWVMTFKGHERLTQRLMSAYRTSPPPGYSKVSLAQIKAADEMFFELAGQLTRRGIQASGPGEQPVVDAFIGEILADTRFSMLLTPLFKGSQRDRSRSGQRRKTKSGGKGDTKKKGKGKGKSKNNDTYRTPIPHELLPHGVAYTSDDEAVCFGFNTKKGCSDAGAGEKCKRGWHVCAYGGCFKDHPYHEHGKKFFKSKE